MQACTIPPSDSMQNICVHYCSGVIQSRSTHHRAAHIPAHNKHLMLHFEQETMLTNHLLTLEKLAWHICWGVWYIANKYEKCVSDIHLGVRAPPTSRRDRPAEACWVQASAHSAAHRNITQKKTWMRYSGKTSWGSQIIHGQKTTQIHGSISETRVLLHWSLCTKS